MCIDPDWISAIANTFIAGGIFLAWKQLKADHERSRREKSVELLGMWSSSLKQHSSAARKLVETFSFEQAKSLWQQECIQIDSKYKGLVAAALESGNQASANAIQLNEKESSELRWLMVSFLNNLEAILSAWRNNVADKKMLEEQFRYLVSREDNHFILEKFRQAAGGADNYPSIHEFVEHIKKLKDSSSPGKSKIA